MSNNYDKTPLRLFRKRHLIDNNSVTPLKIPASPLLQKLGLGTGVEVLKISRSPRNNQLRSPWALKRIAKRCMTKNTDVYKARLIEEAQLLKSLTHPNIVQFKAMQKLPDGRDVVAMELCTISLGDLLEQRMENGKSSLEIAKVVKVGNDISQALDYLHTVKFLLHGDLKSFNILIKNDFEICKLCDFGVSLHLTTDGKLDMVKYPDQHYVGTELWSAPEVLEYEPGLVTTKSEVWSLGLCIYEMLTLYPPHTVEFEAKKALDFDESKENDDGEDSTDDEDLTMDDLVGTRPLFPAELHFRTNYDEILQVFSICTQTDPKERPSAKILAEIFGEMMKK